MEDERTSNTMENVVFVSERATKVRKVKKRATEGL